MLVLETEFLTVRHEFAAHRDYVYSLAWLPDGERLVTVSGDRTARVWDPRPLAPGDARLVGIRAPEPRSTGLFDRVLDSLGVGR